MTHELLLSFLSRSILNNILEAPCKSSWRNRLARSTVNREVVGSIPTEDAIFDFLEISTSLKFFKFHFRNMLLNIFLQL